MSTMRGAVETPSWGWYEEESHAVFAGSCQLPDELNDERSR